MAKEKKQKGKGIRVLIVLFLLALIVVGVLGVSFLKYREKINNTKLVSSYRISAGAGASETAELVKTLAAEELGEKMIDSDARSHLYLHLAATGEEAEALGFDSHRLTGNSFAIARWGNGLFVFALNENSAKRGVRYLFAKLVNQNGELLIGQDEEYLDQGKNLRDIAGPGGISLATYSVVCGEGVSASMGNTLSYYLQDTLGELTAAENGPCIYLEKTESGIGHEISFSGHDITLSADSDEELKAAIYEFANVCLGYEFAGSAREHRSSIARTAKLPEKYSSEEESWIAEREPILTLWNTNYSRGIYLNDSTSLKTDLMSYSDEQLYEYVRMMKFCGFTGIQVTDMCSAWAGAGGYEYVHERLRFLADAAHSMGMKCTLWVWGAEFTGYGWCDDSVTYDKGGHNHVYENPDSVACFEKYYSIYAQLADCCDRVIGHYYDPGNLSDSEDVAFFAKLLRDKFTAVNPKIDFGVSCWVDQFDKKAFLAEMGNNITLYEGTHHDEGKDYENFRTFCNNTQVRLGTWAWNTGEMEIDQLAQMNFQPHIIQETYQIAKQYDGVMKPDYWSEMDSNHVVNIFSLYCEAKLLQAPDRYVGELTEEVAAAAVGPEYGSEFAKVLCLIEKARSGETWNTFWWRSENYILKSEDYPLKEILKESNEALKLLDRMIAENVQAYELPLPISLVDLLRLIRSQVAQINAFAEFRYVFRDAVNLAKMEEYDPEEMEYVLKQICKPVSEYNTVIGLWGQIEARAQREMLLEFGETYGIEIPEDPTFKQARKNRIYSYFVSYQKGHNEPVKQYAPYFQYGVAYGEKETVKLVEELIEEGLFLKDPETGGIYVADWEHYKFAFN